MAREQMEQAIRAAGAISDLWGSRFQYPASNAWWGLLVVTHSAALGDCATFCKVPCDSPL
jgi:hypothetical protein